MSVAGGNAPVDDKKPGYCEDSTDSDNDTERKQLLRRISTSKCVGRLVSPGLDQVTGVVVSLGVPTVICRLGRGEHYFARAT
ncbi:unnamed protein product [Arctia plantaginis]|uniref:Uncharacterized protein n=1 Tax=Arctia plantaginis TaxID=874455 RepID=A0A8S1BB28_ARCPL|nr:unnamed protein product [Arctia plantaginis]CAB3256142.1 unnamed protein product [Arctia plantaginis]